MQPGFRKRLVDWYAADARSLPWRSKPAPYRVWVSEIMLQQTRVEAVRDYFKRFMKRFPSLRSLAGAELDDVLEAWSGLGYYRRARMLHAAALQIAERHNGRFPRERADVLALPGVGKYTAGAILSIAFNQPEPIVDGNVERVFARLQRIPGDVKAKAGSERVWQLATGHVQRGADEGHSPSTLNQALMELGALVCTPQNPNCEACPVRRDCGAHRHGETGRYPVLPKRARAKARRYLFAAITDEAGRLLLVRRPEGDKGSLLPGGMWELPHVEWAGSKEEAVGRLAENLGGEIATMGKPLARNHAIMNFKLTLNVQRCRARQALNPLAEHRWLPPAAAENAAIASATRKLLRAIS
ncbi:MAG: A/G-specific adenine glycosylase [Planctomycetes bacterium]|nr:A/G-specific adenine glycosylase [Planctomycetota bacterium]